MPAVGHMISPGHGAGAGIGVIPLQATLDVSVVHVGKEIIITDIDGVDLSEFSFISLYFNNIQTTGSGSNSAVRMQLSADGGSTWLDTNREIRVNGTNGFIGSSTSPTIIGGSSAWFATQWITDFNSDAPTCVESNQMKVGFTGPNRRAFVTNVAQAHNAIKFDSFSDGSVTFSTGSIELVGYRTPKAPIQSKDLGAASAATHTFPIPSGHTIAHIYGVGVGKSVKERMRVRVGTGGTPVSGATDYRKMVMHQNNPDTFDASNMDMSSADDVDCYGRCTIMNLNIAAPVRMTSEWLTADTSFPLEMRFNNATVKKEAAYDEVTVYVDTGTMDAGVIYCQTYSPATKILLAKDFGAASGTEVKVTGLNGGNSTGVVWTSFDHSFTGTDTDALRALVTVGGVVDQDINDYTRHQINVSNHSVSLYQNGFGLLPSLNEHGRGSAFMVNLPLAARTHCMGMWDWSGSTEWYENAIRDAAQVEDGLQFEGVNGTLMDEGTLWCVGYGL